MILKEEKRDLFSINDKYALVHCISEDCEMGAGIAVAFQKKFNMRNVLKVRNKGVGTCCVYGDVKNDKIRPIFNLITKKSYWHRPTYENFTESLKDLMEQCIDLDVKYLAMPKIGCGLDRLQWGKVREIINEVFQDVDIEILVCHL